MHLNEKPFTYDFRKNIKENQTRFKCKERHSKQDSMGYSEKEPGVPYYTTNNWQN